MREDGFEYGEAGVRQFAEAYGVLEKITTIEPSENACSEAKVTTTVKRRPGASPLLFGKYLMNMAAFVSLEDISDALPPYTEEVVAVEMDPMLASAYAKLEDDITASASGTSRQFLGHQHGDERAAAVSRPALRAGNTLRLPTRMKRPANGRGSSSRSLRILTEYVYAKERRLIEEIKERAREGSQCSGVCRVHAEARRHARLQELLLEEGIRAEVLTAETPPEQREAWYERQLRNGMQVCICHPKLVQTGLDLLRIPNDLFRQTGYSIYTLRQASRRSWRIGQKEPVRVAFSTYSDTAQESCLRLMGKKLLVSLAMEGKLHAEGLQAMDEDDDLLTAMARELVTRQGVGEQAAEVWRSHQMQHTEASVPSNAVIPVPQRSALIQEAAGGATALDRSRFARSPAFALLKFGGGLGRT